MRMDDIPEALQNRLRLAVVAALYHAPQDFRKLKEVTGATDGNLSIQLTKLEECGYMTSKKAFEGKKPKSTYTLTETGRIGFQSYIELLENVLRLSDKN